MRTLVTLDCWQNTWHTQLKEERFILADDRRDVWSVTEGKALQGESLWQWAMCWKMFTWWWEKFLFYERWLASQPQYSISPHLVRLSCKHFNPPNSNRLLCTQRSHCILRTWQPATTAPSSLPSFPFYPLFLNQSTGREGEQSDPMQSGKRYIHSRY